MFFDQISLKKFLEYEYDEDDPTFNNDQSHGLKRLATKIGPLTSSIGKSQDQKPTFGGFLTRKPTFKTS